MEGKFTPTNLNIGLGAVEISQERRKIYQEAATKSGKTLSAWARSVLDQASGFSKA